MTSASGWGSLHLDPVWTRVSRTCTLGASLEGTSSFSLASAWPLSVTQLLPSAPVGFAAAVESNRMGGVLYDHDWTGTRAMEAST